MPNNESTLGDIFDKYKNLENYYEKYDIPYLESTERIISRLEKLYEKSKIEHNVELYNDISMVFYYLVKHRKLYDRKLKEMGVKFPLTKKEKRWRIIKIAIITGTIVATGLTVGSKIHNVHEENIKSNVCVEYEVNAGDTKNELEDVYGLKDIGFSYQEISGYQRQVASGGDTSRFLAAGDVIIGRTTKENADKLVKEKGAKIITKEEAVELLEQSGLHSYTGVFADAINGDNTFVFYSPTDEKTLG